MKIQSIRWKNLLSTGGRWTKIILDDHKTTLVLGKNGSGKTTLLDAISFGLFGKPFRKIRKPQLVNSINNKDCVVEIVFQVGQHEFLVRRGIKPDIFEIYKNGEMIKQNSDVRDYQAEFEKYILKCNHKTFCQIVIMGSAAFTPFMALSTPDRRLVIEDLLDLEVFSRMRDLLSKKKNDLDNDLYDTEKKRDLAKQKYELTEKHLKEQEVNKEALISEKESRLHKLFEEAKEHKKNIELFDIQLEQLEELYDKPSKKINQHHQKLKDLENQLQHKIYDIEHQIEFFYSHKTCPTCKQEIREEFKEPLVKEKRTEVAKVQEGLEQIKKKIDASNEKVQSMGKLLFEIQEKVKEKHSEIHRLDHNNFLTREIEKEIQSIRNKIVEDSFEKLEDIKKDLEKVAEQLATLSDDKTVIAYATSLLKDTGIKSRIIRQFIPVINQLIQKYLADLDFFVEFTLDDQFKETIKSRHRDTFSYDNFSEGEKVRLNLAILFAWRDIARLRSSVNVNLLVFDELFDSALDSEGIDDISRILQNLTNDNVVIISHRDQISERFDRVIQFKKTSNFSRMEVNS